jgi:aspartyl-tRNA(Asn)/glutamyl-tRNA(Gln) amidotransferase subunit C
MDLKTVMHVAKLARLDLSEAEAQRLAAELSKITGYIESLGKVDVSGAEATVQPVSARNQWREDVIAPSLSREVATRGAAESEQNFFKVPPVIE